MSGLAQLGGRATYDLDRRLERGLAGHADGTGGYRIDGNVPETGAWRSDASREVFECAAVIRVAPAILEAAKVRIAHQADVAGLGALDNDNVVFVKVLALVNELQVGSKKGAFAKKSAR